MSETKKIEEFYNSLTIEKETFRRPLSHLIKSQILITEVVNSSIVGIAGVHSERVCCFHKNFLFIVIRHDLQNQGYGQRLVNRLILRSQKLGISYIALTVKNSNYAAIHLYKKAGFTTIGKIKIKDDVDFEWTMFFSFNFKGDIYSNLWKAGLFFKKFSSAWFHNH